MAWKIHSGNMLGGQSEEKPFLTASSTSQKSFLGGHMGTHRSKLFQTCSRSVSKTRITSRSVLERFWKPLETNFEAFFKVSTWWDDEPMTDLTKWRSVGARLNAMQSRSDKHMSDWTFKFKLTPTIVQNPAPRGPNGIQNQLWRHPGRPSRKENVF